MFIRRRHPLAGRINTVVQRMIEGGLLVKWQRDIEVLHMRSINTNERKRLTNAHLIFGWMLFLMVTCFSIGGFIIEHIVAAQRKRRNDSRFWLLAEQIINDQRYFMLPE